jgi:serine/threonine protein kinase
VDARAPIEPSRATPRSAAPGGGGLTERLGGASDIVQTCRICFTEGGTERTGLRRATLRVFQDDWTKGSILVILDEGGQVVKQTRLVGYRVLPLHASRTTEDAVPSFADNCICLRRNTTEGFALAFPSAEDRTLWCDRLCALGCIMRDINDHMVITATFDDFQLARPISNRTTTTAEVVCLKSTHEEDRQSQLFNEARFLMTLQNKNIPRAYGIYEVKLQGIYGMGLIIDYFEGHDLASWIGQTGFPEWVIKAVVAQLRNSLLYLTDLNIVHRDIKPSNVFVEPASDGKLRVVLGDFGLATFVDDEDISRRCGSPGFIAPEMFLQEWPTVHACVQQDPEMAVHVQKIDVFSLAVLIYGMSLATNPLIASTITQTYKLNAKGRIHAADLVDCSNKLRTLVGWMFVSDPIMRCSISEASAHPWFGVDLVSLGFAGDPADVSGDSISWTAFEQASGRAGND